MLPFDMKFLRIKKERRTIVQFSTHLPTIDALQLLLFINVLYKALEKDFPLLFLVDSTPFLLFVVFIIF